jgi:hypothetical protein
VHEVRVLGIGAQLASVPWRTMWRRSPVPSSEWWIWVVASAMPAAGALGGRPRPTTPPARSG